MIKIIAQLRQAIRAIVRFRRRALFMMAGVLVGIAVLTIIDSIGENTRRETMKRVKNMLGTFDTVLIRPGGKSRGMVSLASVEPSLKFDDADAISNEIAEVKQVASLQNAFDVDVTYRGQQTTPTVFGVSSNWLDLRGDSVAEGDFFSTPQVRQMSRVAVLGSDAQKTLFGAENPVGETIRIGGVPFKVIGLLAPRGAGPAGASLDNLVLIPVSTASRRLFNRDFLTMIIAQLKDPAASGAAIRNIRSLLRTRHHLAPAVLDDFNITDPKAVFERLSNVGSLLDSILRGVAGLAMVIGGVVIMSLMVTGVSERQREIGLRRSVGASRADILFQFLLEACLVAALGGALGALVGMAGVNLYGYFGKTPAIFSTDVLLTALGLAASVGILFGLYPAWRASRVDPVLALRV